MKNALRKITIVLGLLSVFGFLWTGLGFVWQHLGPRYMSSSDRLGSNLLLFLISAVPALIGAAAAGLVGAAAFHEIRAAEVAVLTVLIAFWYANSFSFRWNLSALDVESRIGWLLSVLLVAVCCVGAFAVTHRKLSRAAAGGAA